MHPNQLHASRFGRSTRRNKKRVSRSSAKSARMMIMERLERRDLLTSMLSAPNIGRQLLSEPALQRSPMPATQAEDTVTAFLSGVLSLQAEGEGLGVDYGDAPDGTLGSDADKDGIDDGIDRSPLNAQLAFASPSYNTLEENKGPSHQIVKELFLGEFVDAGAGLPNYSATGDDADNSRSDDDGVVDPHQSLQLVEGEQPRVNLRVTNVSGREAILAGWIDYNRDGTFDNDSERATARVASSEKGGTVTLVFPEVPKGSGGQSWSRFRLSTDETFVNNPLSTGAVKDGEVEDYGPYMIPDGTGALAWINPGNWNQKVLPQSIDSVYVPENVDLYFYDPAYATQNHPVAMLAVDEGARLILSDGGGDRLLVSGSAQVDGSLLLQSQHSMIGGTGTWRVFGDTTWQGGTPGYGGGTVELHGHTTIEGDTIKAMSGGTLRNFGTMEYVGENLRHLGGSFVNEASGVFDFSTDGDFLRTDGGHVFHNLGLVRKFAGKENGTTLYNNLFGQFINDGVLEVVSGAFNINANGLGDGRFEVAPNAHLGFYGESRYQYGPNSQIIALADNTGEGRIDISVPRLDREFQTEGTIEGGLLRVFAGRVRFTNPDGVINLQDVRIDGGDMGGPAEVHIFGNLHLQAGQLNSLTGNATGSYFLHGDTTISGDKPKGISSTVTNFGTITWNGSGPLNMSGQLINEGTWRIHTDARLARYIRSFEIDNRGTIIKEPDPQDPTVGSGSQVLVVEKLTNQGELILQSGTTHVQTNGQYCNIQLCPFEQIDGGRIVLAGGNLASSKKIYINGGEIVGQGTISADMDQSAGDWLPGSSPGQIQVNGSHTVTSDQVQWNVEIAGPPLDNEGNSTAGSNFDQLAFGNDLQLDGTLNLSLLDDFVPAVGDRFPILTASSISGTFANVTGTAISPTLGWTVTYDSGEVVLVAEELDAADIAEQLRQQFNQGVLATRASLPEWMDAGDLGLPGTGQSLGTLFAPQINIAATSLLPTLDSAVAGLDELQSQLESVGYTVLSLPGSGSASDALSVRVGDRSAAMTLSRPSAPGAFDGLSKIPDEANLQGRLEWNGSLNLTDVALGIDPQGFFIDSDSRLELSVQGGGGVSEPGFALSNGLSLDFDGMVIVEASKPIAAALQPIDDLYVSQFSAGANDVFNVNSSGEARLEISHTLAPGGLTYDGVWNVLQDCSGEQCELQEIASTVDYPSVDDWLATGIGLLGGIVETLLGDATAANFAQLSLPLIADATATDADPRLFGTNTAQVEESESSWMDKLFSASQSILSFFESDDGNNTVPSDGQGQFNTQGDRLIRADIVRFDREVDGSGTKIGVISTGASGLLYAQLSGDVPANIPTLIGDESYGGRGTAMLEVIHDVAPGAELSFAAATDSASLLNAITWLVELQDVDVIISDVVDYSAAMFEVDPLNAAIQQRLEEHDVLFVQAAGNDAQKGYRDSLDLAAVQDGSTTRQLHRFGGTASNPVTRLPMTIDANSAVRVVLHTSQPYYTPTGIVVANVASLPEGLQLSRLGFPLNSTTGRDPAVPRTVDSFALANETNAPITVDLVVELLAGELAPNTEFQLVVLGNAELNESRGSSLFGAAQLDEVLVVGAVDVAQDSQVAGYSSGGASGGRVPDVVGPAGVEVSGFGTEFFSDFHGTSSAAAHVAAAVALLRQVAPTASHSQIRQAVQAGAKPLGSGVGDAQSGYGLIDTVASAQLLMPKSTDPAEPPAAPESGLLSFLDDMPHFASINLPTQAQLEGLLSGTEELFTDLLQLQLSLTNDSIGSFRAELPFDLSDIGSFDQFDASGRVALQAEPDITLQLGWDDSGPYVDVGGSQVQVHLTGVGEARGVALGTFGLGAGATITAAPWLDLESLDRQDDGKIRLDDAQALLDDISQGNFGRLIPQLTTVDADLYGDVILAFMDYVDVEPDLPNSSGGGDPFIVRGRADLQLDFTGPELSWAFSDFRIANPDIDEDGRPDYTLGVLAENAVRLGETLINSVQVPDFVTELLGQVGMGLGALRDEALTLARGMLPDDLFDTVEATNALSAINTHIAIALDAAGGDASQVDAVQLTDNIKGELANWLVGDDDENSPSGEGPPQDMPIMDRLGILFNQNTRAQVDDPSTPQDEFELSLNQALSSYLQWKAALAHTGFTPEEIVSQSELQRLHDRLENSLRYAIQRAHVGAIELHLAGAPLNHEYAMVTQPNGSKRREIVRRGVFDRAIEAIRWARTAEYLEIANSDNGLSVAQALDEMAVRVVVENQELLFPEPSSSDGYVGGEEALQLRVKAGWQIKLPGSGAPDIDDYADYTFGPVQYDAGGNISLHLSGASNNNQIAGPQLALSRDPVTGMPTPSQTLEITTGQTDATGGYLTQVRLGEGDTFAQVQVDVGLQNIPMVNRLTNRIEGRPSITLFGAHGSEDGQSLRDNSLYVEPGGLIALEARVRRGKGYYNNASLSFYLSGGGSLDQVEARTTYHVPRTDLYGTATVFYSAPLANAAGGSETVRIGAVLIDDGQFFEDALDVQVIYEQTSLLPDRNPIARAPQDATEQTESIRQAFASALADSSFDQLSVEDQQQLVSSILEWYERVESVSQTALQDAALVSANDIRQVEDLVAYAVNIYLEWLAYAKLAQVSDVPGQSVVQANLMSSMEAIVTHWLNRFDGSTANGGLLPLYDSLAWANAIDLLVQAHPNLMTSSTSTRARIVERSRVAVELLPVDASQTSPAPKFSGTTLEATLELRAQVVIRSETGTVTPVMQGSGTPSPVEVSINPRDGAVATLAIPPEISALLPSEQKQNRSTFLGSLLVVQNPIRGAEFVPVDSKLTATLARLPNQRDLTVDIQLGLPGLPLRTVVAELRDPPDLDLSGSIAGSSNARSDSLVLDAGQQAELTTTLFRNNKPVEGEIQFTVIGRGRLSHVLRTAGPDGIVDEMLFTPPATPLNSDDSHGASQITATYVQDGVIYTDTMTIRYEYDATGNDGELKGTPDNIRALNRLELALRNVTTVDSGTELPVVDQEAFQAAAVQILHDWWNGTTPELGGVVYWLQQVQSLEDGGVYPLDTEWKDLPDLRDQAYRKALDAALENWLQWRIVATQLGLEPSQIVSNVQMNQLHALVVGGMEHAIERTQLRTQARATEYIDARAQNNLDDSQLNQLLARVIQEGDGVFKYYSGLLLLRDFQGIDFESAIDLEDLRAQLPYEVVLVEAVTGISGTAQDALVEVQAALTVKGLEEDGEPILFLPPASSPLVVQIDPLGQTRMQGAGVGRTDANGFYDRTRVSLGDGDSELAVEVHALFNFDNTNDGDLTVRNKARAFAYASKRLVFDPSSRVDIRWASESEGPALLSNRSRSVVDGERVLVEIKVTKGRKPRAGQAIVLSKLGQGSVDTGVHITDGSGRVRVYFYPPEDEIGRTQLAVAYQIDGETIVETVDIDYTTSTGETEINRAYSKAQAIAEAKLAHHLAVVSFNALIGDDREIDQGLVESIQIEWLNSGLDDNGMLIPDVPQGVLARVVAAEQATPEFSRRLVVGATREYFQWVKINSQLALPDSFNIIPGLRDSLQALAKQAIDSYVTDAIRDSSAPLAQAALDLARQFELTDFFLDSDDEALYSTNAVLQRLGYEVRIDRAEILGEANNAIVQAVVGVYLNNPDTSDPNAPKIRSSIDTEIDVENFPLGFRLTSSVQSTTNGIVTQKVRSVQGDANLELVLRAKDAYAASEVQRVSKAGHFQFTAGLRQESDGDRTDPPLPDAPPTYLLPLSDALSIHSGETAIIEGRLTQGNSLVPVESGTIDFRITSTSFSTPPTVESIGRSRFRITAGDEVGTLSGVITSRTFKTRFVDGQAVTEAVLEQVPINLEILPGAPPSGEETPGTAGSSGGGLLGHSAAVGAFNELSVPLAEDASTSQLGNAFGLDSLQLPFESGDFSTEGLANDLRDWFANSLDLLHLADLSTIVDILNGGFSVQPEELIRLRLDLDQATANLPATLLAADFSGLLPDGFGGSVQLDTPKLGGQIVFGIDTSSSPFYVLTNPDTLVSSSTDFQAILDGEELDPSLVGDQFTDLTAAFGVAATFNSTEELIDGILTIPHASGYLSSKIAIDFSDVAAETGKLRFHQLDELANLRVDFDGNPLDTFQAIVEAEVTLPDLDGGAEPGNPLANVQVAGAIFVEDDQLNFQLRTTDPFRLPQAVLDRLATDSVDLPGTAAVELDDPYENNDRWQDITNNHPANLGSLVGRVTIGGQDPATSGDVLALTDSADWFRFETSAIGNASSFVQLDFEGTRGDLDLALYRLDGEQLTHIRTDELAFSDSARITLLGQPAGTYFARVYSSNSGSNPFYALTIDPPGRLDPGVDATIGSFSVRDTALEINVDSNLELVGTIAGRVVMTFGEQDDIPVELAFSATLDTVVDDPNENGGFQATISSGLGGGSVNVANLRNSVGQPMPPPTSGLWSATVDANGGGFLLFDYVTADEFKFAGLDAGSGRWVIGQYTEELGWHVPDSSNHRAAANLPAGSQVRLDVIIDGNRIELWVKEEGVSARRVLTKDYSGSENIDGLLGIGSSAAAARFQDVRLATVTSPSAVASTSSGPDRFSRSLFEDTFDRSPRPEWRSERGVWRVDTDGHFAGRSLAIELGQWLLVDSAEIIGTIDVQFNDNNLLIPPPLAPTNDPSDGSVSIGLRLEDINALLFRVEDDEQGTPLYPDREDSPKGLVAINDGEIVITPSGVELSAGRAVAGLQDVLFVEFSDASIDLTTSDAPLLTVGDVSILVPALSPSENFVSIATSAEAGAPLFGLSKPTVEDPIPEFLLFQDDILINFNTSLIQKKVDPGGVFPFELKQLGLQFNDAGSESGRIGNLADFSLLATGEIDFTNDIFSGLPFTPIFAVGQPEIVPVSGRQMRVSDDDAYVDACDTSAIADLFPGFDSLCSNGFVSAELNLGALLGNQPGLLLNDLGPIYVGFADATLIDDPQLTFHGLVELGGFKQGRFVPSVAGSLAVTGAEGPLASITVAGEFVGPTQVAGQATANLDDDAYETRLVLDWIGEASGSIGSEFGGSVENAGMRIHSEFINTSTAQKPFELAFEIVPELLDTGEVCINLGSYVEVCGRAVLNPDAGPNEPIFILDEGQLLLGSELGPVSGVGINAGELGVGADGTVYVLPAGYEIEGTTFERGTYIELAADEESVDGGLFGLPAWFPFVVTGIGIQFNGTGDQDALTIGNGSSAPQTAVALTNPANFSLVISGGLQGNEMFPVTGNFERLEVDLGKLAGSVATALESSTGLSLEEFPGQIFAAPADFPIVGLDGLTIGIEPVDLPGGISIGGTLGLGVYTFERPNDPADASAGTTEQKVFYGVVEGEFTAAKIGLGVELIITQYGPVLARLKAGVPIPLGTLVGALGGPVGAAAGTASGFLITGLEGGIVFGGEPLPAVMEPTDIFNVRQIRDPLRVTPADVRNTVEELAFKNPTFAELLAFATDPGNALDALSNYQQVIADILTGRVPGLPVEFTWDDGYRIAISGTITNQYVAAQLGLGVTLGLNVGYDFDALLHTNGAPVADGNGNALDQDGNFIQDLATGAIQTANDAFGFQLYGFADIEVFGQKLVGAGLFLDFSEPLNPVFNVAASLPGAPGLLSLILPAQGNIGMQLDFDGYVEGSVLATITFLNETLKAGSGLFFDTLDTLDRPAPTGEPSPLEQLALQLEADRRHAEGVDLTNPRDARYDERFDPAKSGYDPAESNPTPKLWQQVLDNSSDEITRAMLIARTRPDAKGSSILPEDFTSLDFADIAALNRLATTFVQEVMIRAADLLTNDQASVALTSSIPFWPGMEAQLLAMHQALLLTVDDDATRQALELSYQANLRVARVQAAFAYEIGKIAFESGQAAALKFAEVFNPSLRITGQLSPMFLGFPMGPPSQAVDVTVTKHELTVNGEFSSLALALNTTGLPAFVKDRSVIEVHLPFENLLRDLYLGNLPTIDPLAGDWYGAMETSFSVFGLEVTNSQGLIFPAKAGDLLEERIQVYDPAGDPFVLDSDKILVRNDHYRRLLAHGGILLDGRLTLPRFVTDPFTLIEELQDNEAFADAFAQLADECEIDDLYSCIVSHPTEIMQVLGGLPEVIGGASTLEQVSQVQLFIPNFIDDVLESLNGQDLEELNSLLDPTTATSIDDLSLFVQQELSARAGLALDVLQDAYLVGAYGELPEPFDEEPLPFPTTGKILGIPLGNGRLNGEITDTGFELEFLGTFLGLADAQFEANLNTDLSDDFQDLNGNNVFDLAEPLIAAGDRAPIGVYNPAESWDDTNHNGVVDPGEYVDLDGNGVYDPVGDLFVDLNLNGMWDAGDAFITSQNSNGQWQPTVHDLNGNGVYDAAVMRVGTEIVIGAAPEDCLISPTAFQGAQEAEQVTEQLLSMLAHLGLTDDPQALATGAGNAAQYAFEWIDLNLPSSAGACLRAFSPGFDPSSDDSLRRSGGIEVFATLGIGNLMEGDFVFQVEPSSISPVIPNVYAKGSARQVLLPGLEGLKSTVDESVLGSELEMIFRVEDGNLDASLEGTLTLLGHQFTLAGDTSLEIYNDGIVGEIALQAELPNSAITASLVSLDGDFTLSFDTRPNSLSAAIEGSGNISWPGFSLEDATFEIQVDAGGLSVRSVSGKSNLLGKELQFSGGFDLLPTAPFLSNVTLNTNTSLNLNIGPGTLQGNASVLVDANGIRGSFDGTGIILGQSYDLVRGEFDSAGCLIINNPVDVHFQLPGADAFCGQANAAIALNVGSVEPVLEGDPSDPVTSVVVEFIATKFGSSDNDSKVSIDWGIPGLGDVSDDLILPSDRRLNFEFTGDENSISQSITIEVVRDTFFEDPESFPIAFLPSTLSVTPDSSQVIFENERSVLRVLNDDAPEVFTALNAPADALVFFNFDNFDQGGAPTFTAASTQDVVPTPQQLEKFATSIASSVGTTTIRSSQGLPGVYSEANGNIVVGNSRALRATSTDSSFSNTALHPNLATIEFTVDPLQGYWNPNEIEFLLKGRSSEQAWVLTWSFDDFDAPLASSADDSAETFVADEFSGWVKHRANIFEPSLACTSGPLTFRLTVADGSSGEWIVDNLALSGEHHVANCLADDPDEVATELEQFLDQMDHRLPGQFQLDGPGTAIIRFGQDPSDIDPDPYDQIHIEIIGSSPTETTLRFLDNGDNPAPDQLVAINIVSAAGLKGIDFGDAGLFRGSIDIHGSVADPIQLAGLADGSSIHIQNLPGTPVQILSNAAFGDNVSIVVSDDIAALDIAGGWVGGSLLAESLMEAQISGDFAAEVALQQDLGCFEVFGGNLSSASFQTGLAAGDGDGDAACITATAVDGVGGSITGNYTLDGNVGQFVASGGSFDGSLVADEAGLIQATLDPSTATGGDLAGNIQLDSFEDISSLGGTVSATVTTMDATAFHGQVAAMMLNGLGGRINSPNSFHFAGDVAAIIGHDIHLRIDSLAEVHSIRAISDAFGNPPTLRGDFTARRFGTIIVDENGTADFELTTTGESWQLEEQAAWARIEAPQGSWLSHIQIQPGTLPGELIIDGARFDFDSAQGMLLGDNRRLEAIRQGFQTEFHVIPASWHNHLNPFDVNADGIVSPIDVLLIINHLNSSGSGPLLQPSVLRAVPAPFLDPSDDDFVSPLDALFVINHLNSNSMAGEGEATAPWYRDRYFATLDLAKSEEWSSRDEKSSPPPNLVSGSRVGSSFLRLGDDEAGYGSFHQHPPQFFDVPLKERSPDEADQHDAVILELLGEHRTVSKGVLP